MKYKSILEAFKAEVAYDEQPNEQIDEIEQTELPTPEPAEPFEQDEVVDEVQEVQPISNEVVNVVYSTTVNELIQSSWKGIAEVNSVINTIELEDNCPQKEELINLLNLIVDNMTVNVGILHRTLNLINPKTGELLSIGQEQISNTEQE